MKFYFALLRCTLFVVASFFFICAFPQSMNQIKTDKSYIWGESEGSLLNQTDNEAIKMLIDKLSIHFEDAFVYSGTQEVMNTYYQSIKAVSNRMVDENEGRQHVLRFMLFSEINRIFQGRIAKVQDMIASAERAEKSAKIDDALRYYFWGYCLLKSLPDAVHVTYKNAAGEEKVLIAWVPQQINGIL